MAIPATEIPIDAPAHAAHARAEAVVFRQSLNYAKSQRGGWLPRWFRPGSAGFFILILTLAGVGAWGAWKWRIREDEKAFGERTAGRAGSGMIEFSMPPNPAALRHLARLPGPITVSFDFTDPPDGVAVRAFGDRQWPNVDTIWLGGNIAADAWLKELARPDKGPKNLTKLMLWRANVTDAGLKELARSDSGLKALTMLSLECTGVTDAGLKELARPISGLTALKTLLIDSTGITDAGLRYLQHPESGLRALQDLDIRENKVTDAGIAELQKARPLLEIDH